MAGGGFVAASVCPGTQSGGADVESYQVSGVGQLPAGGRGGITRCSRLLFGQHPLPTNPTAVLFRVCQTQTVNRSFGHARLNKCLSHRSDNIFISRRVRPG